MKKNNTKWYSKIMLLGLILLSLFTSAAFAQVKISGKVTDSKGSAIAGASVVLRGTSFGAPTDSQGEYSFSAKVKPGNYFVEISYNSYKTEVKKINIANANETQNVNASMSVDALGLDAVVVTGTTVATSKRKLGNAIATINAKDLQNSGASSLDGALQGKVLGAQINQNSGNPAGGISITLRGVSTLGGSSEPLYILDGVIINNDSRQLIDVGGGAQNRLVDLNPNDIEKIEVIKGASAAAIYGSRANNGVVQIFTKRGKEGKPVITFNTQVKSSSIRKKLSVNKVPYRFADITNPLVTTTIPVTRYDYQDDIFRNALGTENNIAVSGGTSQTKYYASIGNLTNQGIIRGTSFNRSGLRMNIDQKVGKYVSLTAGANYTYSLSKEIPNGGINSDYGALTGFIFANNFIDPNKDPITGIYPSVTTNALGVKRTNPLEAINLFDFNQRTNRFIGNVGIKIKPINNLTVDYTFGIDTYNQAATAFIPFNNTTASFTNGLSRRSDANVMQLNNDFSATYRTKLNSNINSATVVGGTIQYDRSNSLSAQATNLAPFGTTIDNGVIVAGESRVQRSYWGSYVQQSFDFKDKLFITGAIRSDGSSVFGSANRNQIYPKVSGSYVLSNEPFWNEKISKYVSSVKLRAAWGKSGNLTGIGAFDRFTNFGPTQYNGTAGYFPSTRLGNETIRPEQQTEFEIGTDISLLNDRFGIEFNYYDKRVKDLVLDISLAPSSGFSRQVQNVGSLSNKGIEIMLKGLVVKSKDFNWFSTFSFSNNKNVVSGIEVTKDRFGFETGGSLLSGDGFGLVGAVNGYPAGAFITGFYARNPDGSFLLTPGGLPQRERGIIGANGTYTIQRTAGQPSGALLTNKVTGSPLPKQLASFINEFTYKKLTLKAQFDGAFGFNVFNFTRRVGQRSDYGGLVDYEKELRGEVPKGYSVAIFPIFEEFIEKGDFVKLRELSLGYDLKPKSKWIQNVRFNLVGRNLVSFDNYSGYDPEINTAGQSNSTRGFDFVEVPLPRSFAFGVNLTF
jgi:TonB-dependent starch-binding outer membrane protein SusC